MLPRKIFENDVAGEAIWCILGPIQREKIYHFCSVSVQIWNYVSDPPTDYARKGECTDTRK